MTVDYKYVYDKLQILADLYSTYKINHVEYTHNAGHQPRKITIHDIQSWQEVTGRSEARHVSWLYIMKASNHCYHEIQELLENRKNFDWSKSGTKKKKVVKKRV